MHSFDKTLLARLGFQDPDRKESKHSLACQYLCRENVAAKVWRHFFDADFVEDKVECGQEVCLTKGQHQYLSIVGFLDVVLHSRQRKVDVVIEVKIGRVDVAEIARQMEVYRQFIYQQSSGPVFDEVRWLVVAPWQFHPEEKQLLKSKGVETLRLGAAFDAYCVERAKAKPDFDEEPL